MLNTHAEEREAFLLIIVAFFQAVGCGVEQNQLRGVIFIKTDRPFWTNPREVCESSRRAIPRQKGVCLEYQMQSRGITAETLGTMD